MAAARSRGAGPATLALITARVTGIVTSITMIGPLLVDISRDLGISLGQAGFLAAAAVPQALGSSRCPTRPASSSARSRARR